MVGVCDARDFRRGQRVRLISDPHRKTWMVTSVFQSSLVWRVWIADENGARTTALASELRSAE